MPGAKRKCDEDTWISTQSKKFKCGQLLANVYASTLAQLRMGARNFFNSPTRSDNNQRLEEVGGGGVLEQGKELEFSPVPVSLSPPSSPFNNPPASPLMRDLISDNELNSGPVAPQPQDICPNCSSKTEAWEKCYYCDKTVCHVHSCQGCGEGYCYNCCITKYDNPSGETYSCYNCLH